MTKAETLHEFKAMYGDRFDFMRALDANRLAVAESWSILIDALCNSGHITSTQYLRWGNPFF